MDIKPLNQLSRTSKLPSWTRRRTTLIDGRHRLDLANILGLKTIPVVANLISEQLTKTFIQNADFFKQQLSKGRVRKRVKLLTPIEGGFRNKGVLTIPDHNRLDED